jgi:hypothetical protein
VREPSSLEPPTGDDAAAISDRLALFVTELDCA